jgi:hypothetical protein
MPEKRKEGRKEERAKKKENRKNTSISKVLPSLPHRAMAE